MKQCMEAAGHEHEAETQKTLLRVSVFGTVCLYTLSHSTYLPLSHLFFSAPMQAASFGKCFLSNFPPEPFVSMCRDLRVLNAVRDYTVGIPLTHTQFKQMTVQVLIDR